MTLELNKLTREIDHMGRELAGRATSQRRALPVARALLSLFAREQELLTEKARSEVGRRLRCASPGHEPLDVAHAVAPRAEPVTLIAADGSQIYPDRHGLAFYFVVNVGTIVFRQGSGRMPSVATDPRVFYSDDQVYPQGEPISNDLVNALRGLAEIRAVANLSEREPPEGPPRLCLLDGPLLVWLQRASIPNDRQVQILEQHLACLDRLSKSAAAVAGFVSRPHSAEVVTLLYLAQQDPCALSSIKGVHETQFRGLTDRALFGFLAPGERSALFVRGTAANDEFARRGHAVWFFYLNTGADVARVELPEWVARRTEWLDLVHAAISEQCRFNNGYPYVLTRADEQAVILGEERGILETMIANALARHGQELPELSRKAQQKQVARWRRR